jgi:hyperosmotically inducible periplasmic protein
LLLPPQQAAYQDCQYPIREEFQGGVTTMKYMSAKVVLACVLAFGMVGCNVMRGQSTAGEYVDDTVITTHIKAELLESKKVDGWDVNVDVLKGKVRLIGWASDIAERNKATEIAMKVKGVKSVDNQLKIKS